MPHSSPPSRRDFLKFMGYSSLSIGMSGMLFTNLACSSAPPPLHFPFEPLAPSTKDDLVLAKEFQARIFIKWDEPINSREHFGTNNDYIAYIPLKGKTDEGLLWVNHECLAPVLMHNRKITGTRTKAEIIKEQLSVGGSILHVQKKGGPKADQWDWIKNSPYNRRITGRTPIPFQKGYQIMGSKTAIGTLGNCAGGTTPWGTVLTCEENYENFYGNIDYKNKKRTFIEMKELNWYEHFPFPPEHYGWVVEVDPLTGKAVKRNGLGRFQHEAATIKLSPRGYPVVYMGQDKNDGFIFKFVSSQKNSIEHGTLYTANTEKGIWIPLDLKKNKDLQKHFNSQTDVVTYAQQAAEIAGGTPQARPEDVEINPRDGSVIIALTNNHKRGNHFGSLLKIEEKDGNAEALEFKSSTFLTGGLDKGFASPDNMVFDNKGNLWLTVDMDEKEVAKGTFPGLGHNGLFYIPLDGPQAGKAFQVASAPKNAEFTGPMFSPDYKTLFLSVQHPGDETVDPAHLTSHWPDGPGHLPKSAVIAISGPALDRLTT